MSNQYKAQFPIFTTNPHLVYLDSAASSLKCLPAIEAIERYYRENGTNVHRGLYDLSEKASEQYEAARQTVATFINVQPEEIIFTSGTTAGLNLVARLLEQKLQAGDEIVLTRLEHHANLIPWQQVATRTGAVLKFIELEDNYSLSWDSAQQVIGPKTKILSLTAASNVTGTVVSISMYTQLAKKFGAYTVVDAAQKIAHRGPTDLQIWSDVDFLVFSGHKVYGPTGIGVLFGRSAVLTQFEPVVFGGDMIREVTYETATWADAPHKFEPGTPPIAEAIGLAAALNFLQNLDWDYVTKHETELINYALQQLRDVATIVGPLGDKRVPVFSLTLNDVHPHDIADILNRAHIAIRAGHHCAQPLMTYLGLNGTARASFGIYTTTQDIDALVQGIKEVKKIFQV